MIYEIIKPMKERVRFLVEQKNLFNVTIQENSDQIMVEKYSHSLSDSNSQELLEKNNFNQIRTQSTITISNNYQGDSSTSNSQ